MVLFNAQAIVFLLLYLLVFVLCVVALIDLLRRPAVRGGGLEGALAVAVVDEAELGVHVGSPTSGVREGAGVADVPRRWWCRVPAPSPASTRPAADGRVNVRTGG